MSNTTETVPMTDLGAVNLMLTAIGSVLIPSLEDADTNPDAEAALQILTDTSREVQQTGYHWNKEIRYPIDPSPSGEIILPQNCLRVDTTYTSMAKDLVDRGGRLYDRDNHTFNIGEKVYVDMVVALPFEQLPSAARWYIAVKAARRFAVGKIPSETTFRFTKTDETEAKAAMEHADDATDDSTMANSSPHVMKMRRK